MLPGKILFLIQMFIKEVKGRVISLCARRTIFPGILSHPVAFFNVNRFQLIADIIWRYSTKCERFQLSKIVSDHNDIRVSIVLLYGSLYTGNTIFKSDRGSNICKVIVKNFSYLIAVNDCIIVCSEISVITIPSILIGHKKAYGLPEIFIFFRGICR